MRLLSFDIGIKNMAVCLFHIDESTKIFAVEDWQVLNISESAEFTPLPTTPCTCPKTKPKKKTAPKKKKNDGTIGEILENVTLCNRSAKYERDGTYFCEAHAKASEEWIIPTKTNSESSLKKMKLPELKSLAETLDIITSDHLGLVTKKMLFDEITAYYENRFFNILGKDAKKNAGEIDLITIGRNLKSHLDLFLQNRPGPITHVIMENQISTLATRMKTIQGMLAQYFIMIDTGSEIDIECISSANKLKDFEKTNDAFPRNDGAVLENVYRQHKMDAVAITHRLIEKTPSLHSWTTVVEESKKKDDLADCFLQGLWFLKREKKITYADDLEIKIV
jgi:hypothetical protein